MKEEIKEKKRKKKGEKVFFLSHWRNLYAGCVKKKHQYSPNHCTNNMQHLFWLMLKGLTKSTTEETFITLIHRYRKKFPTFAVDFSFLPFPFPSTRFIPLFLLLIQVDKSLCKLAIPQFNLSLILVSLLFAVFLIPHSFALSAVPVPLTSTPPLTLSFR